MATNQETAVIKARMDRIPSALSPELVERIAADRASGYVNPYRCNDDQVIRRFCICPHTPVMQAKRRSLASVAMTICHAAVCTCSSSPALRAISVAPWGSIAI